MERANFIAAYIEAALFADTPEDAPLGAELAPEARAKLERTAGAFYDEHETDILDYSRLTDANAGHDLWYTQNGHGCGYWENDMWNSAERLDLNAKELPTLDMYVGDDGALYV